MKNVSVEVQQDHLERIIKDEPVRAIAEMIWNALDADATKIVVKIEGGALTEIGSIRITDNGSGIPYDEVDHLFSSLGNSWKTSKSHTKLGREIHGKKGQGRFKAFSLGNSVTWDTHGTFSGASVNYKISASRNSCKTFSIEDPRKQSGQGTTVEILDIQKDFKIRAKHGSADKIRDIFALYLYQYSDVTLIYDGEEIQAHGAIENLTLYDIEVTLEDGREYSGKLSVVEWNKRVERKLMLCLSGHFPFYEMPPGIQARGFDFTAYLSSTHFKELADENRETIVELDLAGEVLINGAKNKLRDHFRARETERSRGKIDEWKAAEIYPYEGEPADFIEQNERGVFNVVAVNLTDYSPDFEKNSPKTQRLIFELVKSAVETDPKTLPKILEHVLNLPKKKQDELADLLRKTSLTSVINAARAVTDRLDFLKGLQILVYDPQSKRQLLERSQLHRMLVEQTWLFGEEFHLVNDDKDLSSVLDKHLELLGNARLDIGSDDPVVDAQGKARIVDLMLSRRVPLPRGDEREHLVVELKRPSQKVNRETLSQISNYAHAVAMDERFRDTTTRWTFIVVSNELDEYATSKAKQKDRPRGLVEDLENPSIQVWVKTWSQIIQDAEGRLKFFREGLNYLASDEEALRYLGAMNEKYLSPSVKKKLNS